MAASARSNAGSIGAATAGWFRHKGEAMGRLSVAIVCGSIFSVVVAQAAVADPEKCREAIDRYNSAISDVSTALRRYASCVSDSRGHDDCSSEFRRLRSAQDDF